jgi:hypothetical protein
MKCSNIVQTNKEQGINALPLRPLDLVGNYCKNLHLLTFQLQATFACMRRPLPMNNLSEKNIIAFLFCKILLIGFNSVTQMMALILFFVLTV